MSNLSISKIVTLSKYLTNNDITLSYNTSLLGFIPEECVVKSISYYNNNKVSAVSNSGMYTIHSNILNSDTLLLSFVPTDFYDVEDLSTSNAMAMTPNLTIMLKSDIPNTLNFEIRGRVLGVTKIVTGDMSITLQFNKYK